MFLFKEVKMVIDGVLVKMVIDEVLGEWRHIK